MNIEVFRDDSFREDQALLGAIEEIICPFYENTTTLLSRELRHCNAVYVSRNIERKINAFAMFAFEDLCLEGKGNIPSVYAGLCASSADERHRGLVFRLGLRLLRTP